MKTQRVVVPLYDLSCGGGGVLLIERVLAHTPGVLFAYVNPATEMAYVLYDPEQVNLDDLVNAIERAGFRAGILNVR
jgi:copper chaperone CopZ